MRFHLIAIICSMLLIAGCTGKISVDKLDEKLKTSVETTMLARGLDVSVDVEHLKALEAPKGFHFYRILVSDEANDVSQEQFLFFDGEYFATDFINVSTNASMSKDLLFEFQKSDIDVSGLSLISGSAGAKNVIIEIADFECSYCRMAYKYIREKLEEQGDVAVYMAHFPLNIHANADIAARIFESGLIMGNNFATELYTSDVIFESMQNLIDHFASQTDDIDGFKNLLYSPEVNAKLDAGKAIVEQLNVRATPVIIINGKKIEGFNTDLIDRAVSKIK